MDPAYKRTSIFEALHRELEYDLIDLRTNHNSSFMIRYTGSGEPLMHKRTLPSLIAFEQVGIPTALITNGSILTKESATELGRHGTFVRFSIDAANANTYANIRRCSEDKFDMVFTAIETINRTGTTLVAVTFLICRENFTQIFEFCTLMKRAGVQIIWLRSLNDPDEFSESEIIRIKEDIRRVEALNDRHFYVFALQFWIYRKINTLHYRYDDTRCWSRFTKAVIQPNGDVISCLSHKDFIFGNINDTPFSKIWGEKRHIAFIRSGSKSACSACIESRFNNSLEFMYLHYDHGVVKVQRKLKF
jgi:MoaA/NifB/PqqE/SkfB family radical SAM enzyme